jgi:hypothetical protein
MPDGAATLPRALEGGQGLEPEASHRLRRGRLAQYGQGTHAGRIVPGLAQLGKAEIDEALNPLADFRLLPRQAHREASGFPQLALRQGCLDPRLIVHT